MSYRLLGEGAMASPSALERLREVEAAVFDCDGTLIETSKSYDLSIRLTITILLREVCGVGASLGPELRDAVNSLRLLGGFNNDWDTTSVILQAIYVHALSAGEAPKLRELKKIDVEKFLSYATSSRSSPGCVAEALRWVIGEAERLRNGSVGPREMEERIDALASEKGVMERLRTLRRDLGIGRPMNYNSSILTALFDEIFLGEKGILEKYGVRPRYASWEGAVVNEKVLVSSETLKELSRAFRKGLGLVTGRGRWETERTLGALMKFFEPEACIFIADLRKPEYEKPSPKPLLEAAAAVSARSIIYVGNSAEDLLMSRNAEEKGLPTIFAGIVSDDLSLQYFVDREADVILDDVNAILKILEVVSA